MFKSTFSIATLLSSRRDRGQVSLDLGLALGAVLYVTIGALLFLNPELWRLLGFAH